MSDKPSTPPTPSDPRSELRDGWWMCTWLVRAKFSPVAIPPETIRALQQLSPPQSIGSVESGIFLWRILADDANSAIYYDPHKWPNGPFIDKEI